MQSVYLIAKNKILLTEMNNNKNDEEDVKIKEFQPKQYIETKDSEEEKIWEIEIPKINLVAPIAEGTSQEIMLEYVGHFENTEKLHGNVGLAAHNRGYPINYFAKLKELKINDEIIYKINDEIKKYKINLTTVIEDTDWSYLQETNENKITLITCVENEPSKRRCIQGIEVEEELN